MAKNKILKQKNHTTHKKTQKVTEEVVVEAVEKAVEKVSDTDSENLEQLSEVDLEDESIDFDLSDEEFASYQEQDFQDSQDLKLPVVSEENSLKKTADWDAPLKIYLQEISKYPLLSPEQEKILTQKFVESGDIELAKALVQANLRLVVKIAMEYRYAYQNVLDLIQEGNIGLMKAVSKFDPQKGAKLSYYASWWIRSFILKFILDNFRLVKIGTTSEQKKLFYNLLREKERLIGQGIRPETKLISENLGVSEKSVALMDQRLSSSGGEISLDRPLFDDSQQTVMDTLLNDEQEVDDKLADAQGLDILKSKLESFLSTLNERDREIFTKRLLTEIPPSLQNIADSYGVSRERIRQIEERLVKKLKVYMSEFIR